MRFWFILMRDRCGTALVPEAQSSRSSPASSSFDDTAGDLGSRREDDGRSDDRASHGAATDLVYADYVGKRQTAHTWPAARG